MRNVLTPPDSRNPSFPKLVSAHVITRRPRVRCRTFRALVATRQDATYRPMLRLGMLRPATLSCGVGVRLISTSSRFRPATTVTVADDVARVARSDEPVVFKGLCLDLPAIHKWFDPPANGSKPYKLNRPYLESFGSTSVPLELTRSAPPGSDAGRQRTYEHLTAPLSLLIAHMTSFDHSASLYLAQCPLCDLPIELQADLPVPPILALLGGKDIYNSSLWMGRAPTITPLHRDPNVNLFVQIAGTKVLRLIAPQAGRTLYNRTRAGPGHAHMRGEEMMTGPEMNRLEEAVWQDDAGEYKDVCGVEARLESGDALKIPLGWWHAVHGVGESVNASVNWWFR